MYTIVTISLLFLFYNRQNLTKCFLIVNVYLNHKQVHVCIIVNSVYIYSVQQCDRGYTPKTIKKQKRRA